MADIHATLTGATVWPADLVTAGVVGAAAQVYTGRRRQGVMRTDLEVWLEPQSSEDVALSGAQDEDLLPYLVHVFVANPGNSGPGKTGAAQLATLQAHLKTIKGRYSGSNKFIGDLPEVVATFTAEESVDVDPEETKWIEGTVLVTFVVKG